ncbi:TraX family protein [Caproiciproducens galactitolivorans]|uniref:TraX family protein n=1 Tax=Caproiciproducens galactitolivorans TaxID=642589 RepID=A0ABT4BVA5_9FIRM|nr:TraX family protein [Caproiciproducens galactitolivorans]MCY1714832.1 TraX family protein [Caproiciproducens galactitolivorans]
MSRAQLKILAMVSMLIDHIGALFFPHIMLFRIIGRLAFPLFCFFIAQGLIYTSNVRAYLGRLFLFALLSEIPYDLAFYGTVYHPEKQNVFFTLFLGLIAISLLQTYLETKPFFAFVLAGIPVLVAEAFRTDYGWFGVTLIILFYCLRDAKTKGVLLFALLNTGYSFLTGTIKLYAAAAGVPILLYNGKRGKPDWKYFFYAFYPVHLLLLYFVRNIAF